MDEPGDRGRVLVGLAREAIADGPRMHVPREWKQQWLRDPAASFVTLRRDGELRGCIGTLDPIRPLGDDVAHNAHAAAYRDPRFSPVLPDELELLEVEVSLLSPRAPLEADSEAAAAASLRPGIDGVALDFEGQRATFLPQVWESLPDPVDFLAELRRKARLPARFWHPGLRISRYTVEKFR